MGPCEKFLPAQALPAPLVYLASRKTYRGISVTRPTALNNLVVTGIAAVSRLEHEFSREWCIAMVALLGRKS